MLTYSFSEIGSMSLYEYLYQCIKNDIVENENKYQIHDGITILDNISVENLFEAIYKGDVNKVNYQLENGISPNSINKNGDSVLKVSHRLGRQDIAELFFSPDRSIAG